MKSTVRLTMSAANITMLYPLAVEMSGPAILERSNNKNFFPFILKWKIKDNKYVYNNGSDWIISYTLYVPLPVSFLSFESEKSVLFFKEITVLKQHLTLFDTAAIFSYNIQRQVLGQWHVNRDFTVNHREKCKTHLFISFLSVPYGCCRLHSCSFSRYCNVKKTSVYLLSFSIFSLKLSAKSKTSEKCE